MKINKFNKILALSTLALCSTLGAQSFTINNLYPTQSDFSKFKAINTTGSGVPDNFASYDDGNRAIVVWNQTSGERIDDLNVNDYPYMAMAVSNRSNRNYYSISINPSTQDTYNAETSSISISGLSVLVVKVDDFKNWTWGLQSEPTTFLVDGQNFADTQDDSVIVSFLTDPLIDGGTQDLYTNVDNPFTIETIKENVNAKDLFGAEVEITWPADNDLTYDPNTLGTYSIPISATDDYGQTANATIKVHVVDTTAPDIALADGASLSFNTTDKNKLAIDDIADLFEITDNATDNGGSIGAPTFALDGNPLTEDKTFGADDVGKHTLKVSVKDSSGNSVVKSFDLNVADSIPPEIAYADGSDITEKITAGVSQTFSDDFADTAIKSLFKATDDVDGDVSSSITLQLGSDFHKVGDHNVVVKAKDKAGNEASITIVLSVSEDMPPVFVFKNQILTDAEHPLSESDLTAVINNAYKKQYSSVKDITINEDQFNAYASNSATAGTYSVDYSLTGIAEDSTITEVKDAVQIKVLSTEAGESHWYDWFANTWQAIVDYHVANHWLYWVEAIAGLAIVALVIYLIAKRK